MTVSVSRATIARYAPLARHIAIGFVRRLPRNVLADDVHQAALVGLFDALRKGQDTTHPTFEYYARQRIRGAILDELRAQDWMPRRVRGNPERSARMTLVRLEDTVRGKDSWQDRLPAPGPSPEDTAALRQEYEQALSAPMSTRHRYVVAMTETRGLRFKDVGKMLGVSEPRISQLHAAAFASMRAHLMAMGDTAATTPRGEAETTASTSESKAHDPNDRGPNRTTRGHQGGHPRPGPEPDRVRTSGVGPETSRGVARAVPRGGRLIRLDDHAPSPGLGRVDPTQGLDMAPAARDGARSGSVNAPGMAACGDVLGGRA